MAHRYTGFTRGSHTSQAITVEYDTEADRYYVMHAGKRIDTLTPQEFAIECRYNTHF